MTAKQNPATDGHKKHKDRENRGRAGPLDPRATRFLREQR